MKLLKRLNFNNENYNVKSLFFAFAGMFLFVSWVNAQNCTSDFNHYDSSGYVQFIDQSMNYNGSKIYYWDFGDGNSSYQANPSHQYSHSGTYKVCQTVTDSFCSDSSCQYVTVSVDTCDGNFSYSQTSSLTIDFQDKSSNFGGNQSYYWNFGDGETSNQVSPTHTYDTPGVYRVLQLVYNSGSSSCRDTTVKMVTVKSYNCKGGFSYLQDTNSLQVTFYDQSKNFGGNKQYIWQFGDGSSSSKANPSHTYNSGGSYQVCQVVYDQNCGDTTCKTINVTQPNQQQCKAEILRFGMQGNYSYSFQSNSSGNNLNYHWDFGDGTTSNKEDPNHTFPSGPDTFTVTLIVSNSNCADTATEVVRFNYDNSISGFVKAGGQLADSTKVSLYYYDSCYSNYIKIDSLYISYYDSSYYSFGNLYPGKYLVRAKPLGTQSNQYATTYHKNTANWKKADSIILNGLNDYVDAPINLVSKGSNNGNSTILGNVNGSKSGCTNKRPQAGALANEEVILLDMNSTILKTAFTDQNGDYKFKNVATGDYKVYVEIPGYDFQKATVSIKSQNTSKEGVDFTVENQAVTPEESTSVESSNNNFQLKAYPNPAEEYLNIRLKATNSHQITMELHNMMGQKMLESSRKVESGENSWRLDLEALKEGAYILKLKTEKGYSKNKPILIK